jgi:hypothetical protein
MSEGIYLDNDIVLKTCKYLAADNLVQVTSIEGTPPAILAVAEFALRSHVKRSKFLKHRGDVAAMLEATLQQVRKLEPTLLEIEDAADLEQRAMILGLAFDTGESQLFSMLMRRNAIALATGDKRAVKALNMIDPKVAKQRITCFEQVMATMLATFGLDQLRLAVCAAPDCDKAITACFQCSISTVDLRSVFEGLQSYLRFLRSETGDLLIPSLDLSAIVPQKNSVGIA